MKIYSWNVNGIRAVMRKELFEPFLAIEQPDILCLQETKAQTHEILLDGTGYVAYINSAVKKGYSGTAILSRTTALSTTYGLPEKIRERFAMTDDAYGDPNTEGRVVTAEYPDFYLITVYTPNAKDDLSRVPLRLNHWDPAFLAFAQGLESGAFGDAKPVIFCGDLNVAHTEDDLARPKANIGKRGFTNEERSGFQAFIDAGYIDAFRLFHSGNGYYTWWSTFSGARATNVGWRIDYFLVSSKLKTNLVSADIHPQIMGSDHCPISLTLDL
jgi:exodeoxyribonuclease-3